MIAEWGRVHTQRKEFKGHGPFSSFLNVEQKIVLASKLTRYHLINEYIETSVKKGGVLRIAGCLEHGNMVWEAIQRGFGCHLVGFGSCLWIGTS